MKRVIYTTTCGTVASYNKESSYIFTEKDWNDDTSLSNKPAQYARVVAEKAAFEFAEGKHFDLIVINPNGIYLHIHFISFLVFLKLFFIFLYCID